MDGRVVINDQDATFCISGIHRTNCPQEPLLFLSGAHFVKISQFSGGSGGIRVQNRHFWNEADSILVQFKCNRSLFFITRHYRLPDTFTDSFTYIRKSAIGSRILSASGKDSSIECWRVLSDYSVTTVTALRFPVSAGS
jgi:hypothetical protein